MKSLTPRERFLLTALPAALLLMGYFFFIARPATQEMTKLRSDVEKARDRVPSLQQEIETAKKLGQLEKAVSEEKAAAKLRAERAEQVLAYWNDPDAKARGGEKIGELLASNRVVLVEEAIAEDADRTRFAPLLDSLPSAELWRLRLAGSYDALRETVSALGDTDLPLIPAAIEMEPRVEGNRSIHLWNLWICR